MEKQLLKKFLEKRGINFDKECKSTNSMRIFPVTSKKRLAQLVTRLDGNKALEYKITSCGEIHVQFI